MKFKELVTTPEGRRSLVVGSVAIGVSWAALAGKNHYDNNIETKKRIDVLSQVDGFVNSTVLLKKGATLRSTPRQINPTYAGDASNIVDTVGKNLLVRGFVVSANHPGWVAIIPQDDTNNLDSVEERAGDTVWVGLDSLLDEGVAARVPFSPLPKEKRNATLPATINEKGRLVINGTDVDQGDYGVYQQLSDEQVSGIGFLLKGNPNDPR